MGLTSGAFARRRTTLISSAALVLLLIPKNVLHGFCVVSKKSATLLNYPTTLYDKAEEGRVPHSQVTINLPDKRLFSWKIIREEFSL